jgi:hypothetical protein
MNKTIVVNVEEEEEEEKCCLNPGCSNLVAPGRNGLTTQCQVHLEQHRQRNIKYKHKKQQEVGMLKQKATAFDNLQKKYEALKSEHEKLKTEYQRVTTKLVK